MKIGFIGAGRYCDGQILVINDILGMYSDFSPKFVKQYACLNEAVSAAVDGYIQDVRAQRFPEKKHTFAIDESVLEKLY